MPNDIGQLALATRDLTATDGAQVNATGISLPLPPGPLVATFIVSTTGTPTTYDMRAAIEGSLDGLTWMQLLRFTDVTNAVAASRFARIPLIGAASEAAFALSTLNSAAASATIVDGPWPKLLRAVTKLQTLTGGTSPHVISAVVIEAQDTA